jgi:alpha-amylase
MYVYLKTVIDARKKHLIWNYDQVERYADSEIFAYSRGKFLVCTTNKVSATVQKLISYHPFANGEVICNIFYPTSDCITVNGPIHVYLVNGEAKVYVPK